MKIISYKFLSCEINHGTNEEPIIEQVLLDKSIDWSEANEVIAKSEAYNGEYTIEDDGLVEQPTWQDRIEAQVTYNSMMLGTLIEEA